MNDFSAPPSRHSDCLGGFLKAAGPKRPEPHNPSMLRGATRTLLRGLQEARLIHWPQRQPREKRVPQQQPSIAAFPIGIEEP